MYIGCYMVTMLIVFDTASAVTPSTNLRIGSIEFSEILKTPVFVDKTELVKGLFKDDIILITSPSGFGKSANLNMVKRFFEITVDENGKPVADLQKTTNYQLFNNHTLKIFNYKQFCEYHFGKYPVVYIKYGNLDVSNYENMLVSFRKIINETFNHHTYLLKNSKLWMHEEEKVFGKYINNSESLDEHDMNFAFKYLCRLLRDHFKTKVILLIDDYNNYFNSLTKTTDEDKEEIIEFFRWIHNDILKVNPFLSRAILTGILADGVVLPRNIIKYSFLDAHLANHFGIKEKEIDKVLKNLFKSDRKKVKNLFYKKSKDIQCFDTPGKPYFKLYSFRDFLNFVRQNIK